MPYKNLASLKGIMLDKLPEWQLGWLAGMIDGEGCITILSDGGRPRVTIGSSTPIHTVVQWMTGLGTTHTRANKGYRTMYYWGVYSVATVHKLLSALSSYLLIKREQCDLMLKYCEERLAEGYHNKSVDRKSYSKEIQELNQRGIQD